MNKRLSAVIERLKDERSKKVLFVSHCILNENTRYLGGAFCGGVNKPLLDKLVLKNCGIVQMPCPEQYAWGGILKKWIWIPIDTKNRPIFPFIRLLYPFFIAWTYLVYYRIAANIAKQIQDYRDSGFDVIGIVGIDGSPTCGVEKRIDMSESFQFVASLELKTLTREIYNTNLYRRCIQKGRGIFIRLLTDRLKCRNLKIQLFSIDLEDEMNGKEMFIKH